MAERKRPNWSAEQRAAAAERMRARHAAKRAAEQPAAPPPSPPPPPAPARAPRTLMDEAQDLLDAGMGARAVAEQLGIRLNELSEFAARRREERMKERQNG